MSVPAMTVEAFAARIRGDRGFASDRERATAIRNSELIAAAAYDYCRVLGFSGATREDHQHTCARYVAAQLRAEGIMVPHAAFGLPAILVQLLFGLAVRALVELIVAAAGMIADHLSKPGSTESHVT